MSQYLTKELLAEEVLQLVKDKKAHMFIMVFDRTEITRKGIMIRAQNAFPEHCCHTWFMGEE